ncbi:MAG: hypothetical protein WC091_20835, partial [Sulfuricellaceae bacterium]
MSEKPADQIEFGRHYNGKFMGLISKNSLKKPILCAATICGFSRVSRDAIAAQIAPCGCSTQAICNAEAAPA